MTYSKPNSNKLSYCITKMNRVKVTAFHIVTIDGTVLDIANQKRSLETFIKNCHRFPDSPMDEWYRVKETSQLLTERIERDKRLAYQVPSLAFVPATESTILSERHPNLWAFYDAIGYNRKKQEFYPIGSLLF